MVQLIPSQDTVMEMLKRTGAFREGHFVYPSGKHTPHYFQMPLAFRYYDTARVLAVALSRKFRLEKEISSMLPKIAVIAPGAGGIPVAFGVREALNAEQIYWAEREEDGKRMFRQYVQKGEVNPCVIVDDIIRSGEGHPRDRRARARAGRADHRLRRNRPLQDRAHRTRRHRDQIARRVRRQVLRHRRPVCRVQTERAGRARAVLKAVTSDK